MVEAAQFAAFVGHRTVDVSLALAVFLGDMDFGARLALADHRLQRQHLRAAFEAEFALQCLDFLQRQFLRLTALEQAGQGQSAVADALEPTDLELLRLPQTADFAVAALGDDDAEPRMRVGTVDALDLVELRRAVVERDAALQSIDDVLRHFAMDAADVFAFDFARRMHQVVRKFAVGGQHQQAGGVDVEAADCDPARAFQSRQRFEDGRTAFRIFTCGDFAFGLVVDQHARGLIERAGNEGLAVEIDAVAAADRLADRGDVAIDLD